MKGLLQHNFLKLSVYLFVIMFAFGCKSAKNVISAGEASDKLSAKQVIKQHTKSDLDFKTFQAKLRIDIIEGDKSQGLTFNFRMEKDKTIWLSAPLGLARMIITPDNVRFYNKQDRTYFEGQYELLSDFTGVELDYTKVQNILLGQAIFNLQEEPHKVEVNQNSYALQPKNQSELLELFYLINPSHFKMDSLQLFQQLTKRILQVDYSTYQDVDKQVIPQNINIVAVEGQDQVKVTMEFKSVALNQDLRFPFNMPKGFKEIEIK